MRENDIQVLVTTVAETRISDLIKRMNIQTSFLVGNQTDRDGVEDIEIERIKGRVYSSKERGVGKNRNKILSNATASICIFADDDMVFKDGYEKIVQHFFDEFPNVDIIIFNLDEMDSIGYIGERKNKKVIKVNCFNYMNYGAARIAFRRKVLSYNGIMFNLNFGGGTKHQCGEDTLFLHDCLKKKLKIVAVPYSIALLTDVRKSTWFEGYTRKYFFDKGVFLAINTPKMAKIIGVALVLKHKKYLENGLTYKDIFKEIDNGIKYIRKRRYECEDKKF